MSDKITPEDLEQHRLWRLTDGKEGKRLERIGADLREADLRGACLGGAYLGGAYLGGAYLREAYLREAYLRGADLREADLREADLRGAYLGGAYLRRADLRGANLGGAYLGGAYLGETYLGGADLRGAYLRGAYLGRELKLVGERPLISLDFHHAWLLLLWRTDRGVRVQSGCRGPWTVEQAREHWQGHADNQRRDVVLPALDALLSIAKAQGWETP